MEVRGAATDPLGVEDVAEQPAVRVAVGPPALSLRGISKRWGATQVLDGIDLDLRPGERVWVGGRNGAGKTTLLRIAAGLILPDSGDVTLHGLHAERDRRAFQRRLGFLSAGNTALYARLSSRDNLAFWAGIAFVPRRHRGDAVQAAIGRFGLDELADRRVDRMSMGQRQRVRLAATFLHDPTIVLLDEPETSLDDEGLALLAGALADHVAGGGTAFICSPTRERLGLQIDSAYVIDSGTVVPA